MALGYRRRDGARRRIGLIWVYGPGDEETIAFTDFGIEQLQELIAIHRDQTY